jgi:non-canonical purine NTP pyrophosphatase (RdgB/HAM1 family)
MTLQIATTNHGKAREIEFVLKRPVQCIDLELTEIQAIDVRDIIEIKAKEAYRVVTEPVLVEDTGLYFDAWDGLPGALIRWFLDSVGNSGLCKMLERYEVRGARAETWIGYFDGESLFTFSGIVTGEIVPVPRGNAGFGWDSIFQPTGWDKTFAEMTQAEKDSTSMRKIAALKLKQFLDDAKL